MGMITPEWEEPQKTLEDSLTRMTLTLLKRLDYVDLLSQFDALPDTFLLFLNKLGAITIIKPGLAIADVESTTYSCTLDESSQRATLRKICHKGVNEPQTSLKHYQIRRKLLSNLPWDKQRDFNTAEVILAFPLDINSEPLISRQEVYAYLPIRDFGFSVST
jgi:hypothetical protein